MGQLTQRIVRTIVKKMQPRQKDHNMFLTWVQMIKVMRKQWTGTRAIRRQIPPSKPKWETTKITNRQDTTKTKAWSKCMRLNMLVCVWPVWKLNTAFLRGHSKCQPCLNLQRHEKMISSFLFSSVHGTCVIPEWKISYSGEIMHYAIISKCDYSKCGWWKTIFQTRQKNNFQLKIGNKTV